MNEYTSQAEHVAALLGATIRARRRELELTQKDLADLAGVAVRSIHEVERGKPTIRLAVLVATLSALGLTLHALKAGSHE